MTEDRKGAFQIDLEPMRPGVRGAIQTLWQNARDRKASTGIVLPTRYGKSDVALMGGLGLLLDELASYVVVLEPAAILTQQILDSDRIKASATRYKVPIAVANGIRRWVIEKSPERPFPPHDARFVSMTVQMANNHREFLARWVDGVIRREGIPPVFFVDEAHTGSVDNRWGETARLLGAAGALLVLLTATPYRSDKTKIEGFDYQRLRADTINVRRGLEVWRADKVVWRLVPDHETTFRQAWEELPPALCYISRIPIDVEMARWGLESVEAKGDRSPSKRVRCRRPVCAS